MTDEYKDQFEEAHKAHEVARRVGCAVYRDRDGRWKLTTKKRGVAGKPYSRARAKRTLQKIIDRIRGI